jgi:hypothetical protein
VKSLDELRRAFPGLGFAIYAYESGGPVILEIHSGDEVYTFTAWTEAEAIALAFPAAPPPPQTLTDIFG